MAEKADFHELYLMLEAPKIEVPRYLHEELLSIEAFIQGGEVARLWYWSHGNPAQQAKMCGKALRGA